MNAVTIVFHQYETGLREGTIYTMVGEGVGGSWNYSNLSYLNFTDVVLCIEEENISSLNIALINTISIKTIKILHYITIHYYIADFTQC